MKDVPRTMIREFQTIDTNAVASVWLAASKLAHPFLSEEFLIQEESNLRNIYLQHAKVWVSEVDGDVIGFIAMIENEIGGLFLEPNFHGKGYGRGMVDFVVSKMGPVRVDVFQDNKIGRSFYDGYGFVEIGKYQHEDSGQMTLRMKFMPQVI